MIISLFCRTFLHTGLKKHVLPNYNYREPLYSVNPYKRLFRAISCHR